MRKTSSTAIAIIVIFLFIGCSVKEVSDSGYQPIRVIDTEEDLLRDMQRALADAPIPRVPVSLRDLVIQLLSVTPSANMTDTDMDGLPDIIERVIGTDILFNDSDGDMLNDSFEVFNNLDPLNPDSNQDGINDYAEMVDPVTDMFYTNLDPDMDGLENAWDFDNDGDSISDFVDLSPFGTTGVSDGFDFEIRTDGGPTYLTFNIVPDNPEHMRLFYQTWNWPNGDDEGRMRDLDSSSDDVTIIPKLNITANIVPDEATVREVGNQLTLNGINVRLSPVYEYDSIVALSGNLFYPAGVPMTLNLHVELIWEVFGKTDQIAKALNTSSFGYVTIGSNGVALANTSSQTEGSLQWMEFDGDKVAIKLSNGPYLTVEEDGTLSFTKTDFGENETFVLDKKYEPMISLIANNGKYVNLTSERILVANSDDPVYYELVDNAPSSSSIRLVKYDDDFAITGFEAEECYSSALGVFYTFNETETYAANCLFDDTFIRNSTTSIWDMPTLLFDKGVTISNLTHSFNDRYEAMITMGNEMIPFALDQLPEGLEVPIIMADETNTKMMDLASLQMVSGTSFIANLTSVELLTVKTQKTSFYNTTTNQLVDIERILSDVIDRGYTDEATFNFMLMLIEWYTVQEVVTAVGGIEIDFGSVNNRELDATSTWLTLGIEAIGIAETLRDGFKIIKRVLSCGGYAIATMKDVGKIAKTVDTAASVSKFAKVGGKASFFFEVFCIAIDLALSIWAGVIIANSVGGRLGNEMGATYAVVSFLYATLMPYLMLYVQMFIPFAPLLFVVFSLLDDLLGWGLTDKILGFLNDWIFGSSYDLMTMTYSSDVLGFPEVINHDYDGNDLDVGDRIEFMLDLVGRVEGEGEDASSYVTDAFNFPYITFITPRDSNSQSDYTLSLLDNIVTIGQTLDVWWKTIEYSQTAWIEPGVGMPNYPVVLQMHDNYEIYYRWAHDVIGFIPCRHTETITNSTSFYEFTRMYFDVMPESLEDFASWRHISSNDRDGDGVLNIDEPGDASWQYDQDGNGLCDLYERKYGLNPAVPDDDADGLTDRYEEIYGTNATLQDSDQDGLHDYLEVSGWMIEFDYMGNTTLPFQMHVTSNPLSNDSDSDGASDYLEYTSNTNPRSNDTEGDGAPDFYLPRIISEATFETHSYVFMGGEGDVGPRDLVVDGDGILYVAGSINDPVPDGQIAIRKFDSSLSELTLPLASHFNGLSDESLNALAIDDSNEVLFASGNNPDVLWSSNLNGTVTNPSTWVNVTDIFKWDIDIDANDNVYVVRWWPTGVGNIQKYDASGTLQATWGSYGSGPEQFDRARRIAIDDVNGFFYVHDGEYDYTKGERIMKFNLTDGTYLTTLPNGYDDIFDIDVDDEGYVYVLGSVTGDACVRKFDPNGLEETGFRFYGNSTTNFTVTAVDSRIAIAPDNSIYISTFLSQNGYNGTSCLWKFTQDVMYASEDLPTAIGDWDMDGLTTTIEVVGWDIYVEFSALSNSTFTVTSDPRLNDTDFDLLSDALEYALGSNPRSPDSDLDGVPDHQEWELGTNLTNWDTDGEGLSDSMELSFGSDPTLPNSDSDTLPDYTEFLLNTNPRSSDTDMDGATDDYEYAHGTSPLTPDSDGDFAFDGFEYNVGTDPLDADHDNDGIADGDEAVIGTSPFLWDTDMDGASDSLEVLMRLNPLNSDTDGDGILDMAELDAGTNPFRQDSDFDGIPDNEDPDTTAEWPGPVVVAYASNAPNNTLEFVQALEMFTTVIAVTFQELIEEYSGYQYIVLIGRPDPSDYLLEGLIYDLLEDTGNVLDQMMEPNSHEIATRYGVWTGTQTVMILSEAYETDVYAVLQILRGRVVTLLPDYVLLDYDYPSVHHDTVVHYAVYVNSIDTVKETDSIVSFTFTTPNVPVISMTRYNQTSTPHEFSTETGLAEGDIALHTYLNITLTGDSYGLESATIMLFYRNSDIDRNLDGLYNMPGDVNESSLKMYYFEEVTGRWEPLTTDLDWVITMGQNETDFTLYGESYSGYLWVQVTHLSMFTLAGQEMGWVAPTFPFAVLVLALGIGIFAFAGIVIMRKRSKSRKYKKVMDIFDDMLDSSSRGMIRK